MRIFAAAAVTALAAVALVAGLPGASATAATALASATTTSLSTSAATSPNIHTVAAVDNAVTVSVAPGANGVIKDGQDLKATVSVHNGTDKALQEGVARIYLDRATFSSRSQIEAWFDRPSTDVTDALGSFMTIVDVPALDPGTSSGTISVTIPAETLSLGGYDWGAKAFGVRYATGGSDVTETHSSIVYYPNDSFEATKLAVAVPLTVPASTSGLISSDALASYTSENGVLTQELEAVRGKEVAIGVDPMILASIRILGNTAPPTAVEWLHRLETATNRTFALAYGDADLSAVRQAGATSIPAPIDFAAQIAAQQAADPTSYEATTPADNGTATDDPTAESTGEATPDPTSTSIPPTSEVPTTESLLAFDYTDGSLAWPLESTVAAGDLPVFTSSGYDTTILSSTNVTSSSDTSGSVSTENAAATVSGSDVVVSDSVLSGLLRDAVAADTTTEWRGEVAELSAELATLTHERPSDARTLFATMGRNWATTGSRLDETLAALDKMTWVSSVPISSAVSSTPTSVTLASKTANKTRIAALEPLVKADSDITAFSSALRQPELVTAKERLRELALTSVAWGSNTTGLTSEIAKVTAQAAKITSGISVVQGSPINILGDRSSLPISLQNDTASPAVVNLRVVPSNYFLSVEKSVVAVTIQANSRTSVTVPVQSVANGKVTLTLTLTSRSGVAISTPATAAINVRAGWETLITVVFAVAVVALFGGGIYRNIRRRRRSKSTDPQTDHQDPPMAEQTNT